MSAFADTNLNLWIRVYLSTFRVHAGGHSAERSEASQRRTSVPPLSPLQMLHQHSITPEKTALPYSGEGGFLFSDSRVLLDFARYFTLIFIVEEPFRFPMVVARTSMVCSPAVRGSVTIR